MATLADQIGQARQQGYSDNEIAGFLGTSHPELAPKFQQATKAGYQPSEILQYLSKAPSASAIPGTEKLGGLPPMPAAPLAPRLRNDATGVLANAAANLPESLAKLPATLTRNTPGMPTDGQLIPTGKTHTEKNIWTGQSYEQPEYRIQTPGEEFGPVWDAVTHIKQTLMDAFANDPAGTAANVAALGKTGFDLAPLLKDAGVATAQATRDAASAAVHSDLAPPIVRNLGRATGGFIGNHVAGFPGAIVGADIGKATGDGLLNQARKALPPRDSFQPTGSYTHTPAGPDTPPNPAWEPTGSYSRTEPEPEPAAPPQPAPAPAPTPEPAAPAPPAENTGLLDQIAAGMGYKGKNPFSQLDPHGQETVRYIARDYEAAQARKAAPQPQPQAPAPPTPQPEAPAPQPPATASQEAPPAPLQVQENPERIPEDTHLVNIDPKAFQTVYEAKNGEPLPWDPGRAERLKKADVLDMAPQVGSTSNEGVGVTDGRHRIAEAARRGQDRLPVRVDNGDTLPASVLAPQGEPAAVTPAPSDALADYLHSTIPYSVAAKWDPPMRAKAATQAGSEPLTPGEWKGTLGRMQQLEAERPPPPEPQPEPEAAPEAQDPATPPAANQWERANREAKTDKLEAWLDNDGKGIAHADALRMSPADWKLAAKGAGVIEPSPASIRQTLDKLQRRQASRPLAQRLAEMVNGTEEAPAPPLTGGMGLHLEQNVDGTWAFNGKVPPAAQGKTWPSFAAAMKTAKKSGFEGYVNNRLRGY